MDIKRVVLYILVGVLGFALANQWMKDYPPSSSKTASIQKVGSETTSDKSDYIPSTFHPDAKVKKANAAAGHQAIEKSEFNQGLDSLIHVKTNVLDIAIDTRNGNIVSAKLNKYPVSLKEKNTPVQILNPKVSDFFIIQTGLTSQSSDHLKNIIYSSDKKNYVLSPGENSLTVTLNGKSTRGLLVQKKYVFKKDKYDIDLSYQLTNTGKNPWTGSLFAQLKQRQPKPHSHFFGASYYTGASISSEEIPYKKIPYKDLDKKDINQQSQGGWVAMQQHYFLTALIPDAKNKTYHYYSRVIQSPDSSLSNLYVIGFVSPAVTLATGDQTQLGTSVYVGPEIAKNLKTLAPGLERTIDYGWLWPISKLLFYIMSFINKVVHNWGWTIVLTTILIKIVFYWFSATSFRSMARMREVQPRLQSLKERYKDDRQALSRATMDLYKEEKINPLGGCLPMVIQIPVFIAFYYVIVESVQLRQAPFIFWIHDLSVMDPYYIFPILMGISMLVQQILSPSTLDPNQKKMMWILPVAFTAFFIQFPVGLVLYWLTNNIVQTLQQWYVNKTYEKYKSKRKHAKKLKKNK